MLSRRNARTLEIDRVELAFHKHQAAGEKVTVLLVSAREKHIENSLAKSRRLRFNESTSEHSLFRGKPLVAEHFERIEIWGGLESDQANRRLLKIVGWTQRADFIILFGDAPSLRQY
jgi:hypothetical protein